MPMRTLVYHLSRPKNTEAILQGLHENKVFPGPVNYYDIYPILCRWKAICKNYSPNNITKETG